MRHLIRNVAAAVIASVFLNALGVYGWRVYLVAAILPFVMRPPWEEK